MVTALRSRVAMLSLVVGPLLTTAGDLMHPKEDPDAAVQAAIVVSHASRWYSAHLLLLIGILLFVPGILALTGLATTRRARLGYVARILILAGIASFTAIFAFEMLLGRIVQDGANESTAVAMLDTFQSGPVFGVLATFALMFFLGTGLLVYVLAARPGPFRWPSLALAVGALFILVEISSSIVLFSQMGNALILVSGVAFAWLIARREELAQELV